MATVLIIMSVGSHQNATFGLAKELQRAGYNIVYAGSQKGIYQENLDLNIKIQGFDYEILDPYAFKSGIEADKEYDESTNDFINFAQNIYDGSLFENFIERVQPDIILLDIHLPLYAIAFYPFKIPVFFISTELLTTKNDINPPLNSSLIPCSDNQYKYDISSEWDKSLKHNIMHPGIKYFIEELSTKYSFPIEEYLSQKCIVPFGLKYPELILWPQEFEFRTGTIADNIYYVGSWVDIERYEEEFDWSNIISDVPLVYCSLGTVVNHELLVSFLNKLINTFDLLPQYQFIISAGRVYELLKKSSSSSRHIHIFEKVPQLTVLKKSHLMISLGGANSILESISLGVPLLCYPFHSDQFGNSARVEFHKLGLRGDFFKDSSEEITIKIKKILSDTGYRDRMLHFQNTFNSSNLELVKEIIEKALLKRHL